MNTENQVNHDQVQLDLSALTDIRGRRDNPVLFIAASVMDMEALPTLYNVMCNLGPCRELDVVLYGRGGEIVSARRFGIMLHRFCKKLNFIVPFHCASTLTALALAGNEIIAGDMALFSPIDPSLSCDGVGAIDSEDIRLFPEMGNRWFGIESEETKTELLAAISSSIFPSTLTRLYRATQEVQQIASDLLAMGSPDLSEDKRQGIVRHLLQGFHSHNFAPTNDDLLKMGLPIRRNSEVEAIAWQLAQDIQNVHGGGARQTPRDPRNDFIIATEKEGWIRQHLPDAMAPRWIELQGAQ